MLQVRRARRAIERRLESFETADRVAKLLEIRHVIPPDRIAPRGIPYVTSNHHIYRRTLVHDPDASRSWIAAALRAAGARRWRRTRRRWRTTGRGRTDSVDRDAHQQHAENRWLLPALLGGAHRIAVRRDPEARYRDP